LAGHWEKHAIQRCQITETRLGLMGYVGEEGGDTKKKTKKTNRSVQDHLNN